MQPDTLFQTYLSDLPKYSEFPALLEMLSTYNMKRVFKSITDHDEQNIVTSKTKCLAVAMIVCTYSKDSTWLTFNNPIAVVKKDILQRLITDMFNDKKLDLGEVNQYIHDKNENYLEAKLEYVEFQKDNDFAHAVSLTELISNCRRQAQNVLNATDKNLVDKTKYISETKQLSNDLQDVVKKIKNKLASLDEVLHREGYNKLSDQIKDSFSPENLFAKYVK